MSANTSITEGGKARPFGPVEVLMVQGSDGKYYPWFPDSDRALGTLSVDKNGIYRASDKGVYGWSSVSVNVPQNEGVSGKDPDTGEDVYVHPDPETGELVTDVLPVEIRVIEPPTNPYGTYVDGQTITKDGMVVKAYTTKGEEMQVVPIGEITIDPTVAVYDESTDPKGKRASIDDSALQHPEYINQPILTTASAEIKDQAIPTIDEIKITTDADYLLCYSINGSWTFAAFAEAQGAALTAISYRRKQQFRRDDIQVSAPINTRVSGRIVYYNVYGPWLSQRISTTTAPINTMANIDMGDIATILYDGEILPAGSPQTITVSWPRPGDGAVLETTFDITVGPHGGTGDD